MMKQLVKQWHLAFGVPVLKLGEKPAPGRYELRVRLIHEEVKELIEALQGGDIAHIAKEMADVEYVCFGMGWEMGWNVYAPVSFAKYSPKKTEGILVVLADYVVTPSDVMDILYAVQALKNYLGLNKHWKRISEEVHNSNMSKLDDDGKPVLREDGKILKSKNYKPADLSWLNQ